MITTKEAAIRLGITPGGVNQRAKKLGISKQKKGKFAYISEEDFERIARVEQYSTIQHNTAHDTIQHSNDIAVLYQQLEKKDAQLEEKDSQIKELHQLLSQEQQLSASRQQEINQLRNNVKLLEDHRSPELDDMIGLLERTRDTFLRNMKTLNHSSITTLAADHKEGPQMQDDLYRAW